MGGKCATSTSQSFRVMIGAAKAGNEAEILFSPPVIRTRLLRLAGMCIAKRGRYPNTAFIAGHRSSGRSPQDMLLVVHGLLSPLFNLSLSTWRCTASVAHIPFPIIPAISELFPSFRPSVPTWRRAGIARRPICLPGLVARTESSEGRASRRAGQIVVALDNH